MQYGMVIDLSKCMGCQTCATSCRLANNLPSGTWWNTVYTEGGETIDTASGASIARTPHAFPCARPGQRTGTKKLASS